MITLTLPVAPPANNAFINRERGHGYGRIKSARYRSWIKDADAYYVLQHIGRIPPIIGPYRCKMVFPKLRANSDIDGRIKLILDWLVSRKLVQGDSVKFLRKLDTEMDVENLGNLVWIALWSAQDASASPQ